MLKLTLPNGTIKEYPEGITLLEVSRELNGFFTASRWWKAFLTASAPICRSLCTATALLIL